MADNISIVIDAAPGVTRLDRALQTFKGELLGNVETLAAQLLSSAQAKARGSVLRVHSGAFVDSLKGWLRVTDTSIAGGVISDAPQAGIFEWGGSIGAHDILPNAAEALRFNGGAGVVFASVVHDPGAHIDEHSVMRSTLKEMAGQIVSDLTTDGRQFGQ